MIRILEEAKSWARFSALTISRQKWITWLGIIGAVTSAVMTQAGQLSRTAGIVFSLASALAAAMGKALMETHGNQWLTLSALALALINTLTGFAELFSPEVLAWLGIAGAMIAAFGKSLLLPPTSGGELKRTNQDETNF